MNEHEHIQQLYQQFIQGQINPAGLALLFDYFKVSDEPELRALIETGLSLPDDPSEASPREQQALARIDAAISNYLAQEQPQAAIIPYPPKIPRYRWISVAAAVLLLAIYYFWQPAWMHKQPDIPPGYNQATLTLADGTKVALDSAQSGIIVQNEHIVYNDGTKIEAKGVASAPDLTTHYSLLTTPKGGQYQIILPDGTKVWLNAASTLKYPSKFTGDRREVEISGEAYFEIKEDQTKPFNVLSKNQEISVLGTSFNVTAYSDEKDQKTTLASGAIQVSLLTTHYSLLLKPGEQSLIHEDGNITKAKVDVNKELAWRRGLIAFNDEPLEAIMRKIARWYNVDVTYSPDANRSVQIGGSVSRYVHISDVLKRLELTGFAHFSIEGRRIHVTK